MTDKKEGPKRTELQTKFLAYLFESAENGGAEGNVRLAMDLAGYSKNTSLSEVLHPLSEDIAEISQKKLSTTSGEAVFALLDILRNPNALGAGTKLKAASMILDRAGVSKKDSQDVNLKIPQRGLIILPAKNRREDEVFLNEGDEDEV